MTSKGEADTDMLVPKKVRNIYPRIISSKIKLDSISKRFKKKTGYDLNIENPQTFNEKIQWLKLYYRNRLMTRCSDKFAVRLYVEKTIGKEYLIELAGKGVYNSAAELDFETLPNKFVLKVTDGWGANIICSDKSKLDYDETRGILTEWLNKGNSHYYRNFEWAYKNIKPRIICESFLEQEGGLVDYKLWCFRGKVQLIQVCSDRGIDEQKNDYFDTDWQNLNFQRKSPNSNTEIPQPKSLKQMIDISEILSSDFPFVRIDLYEIEEKVRFGEMTFYSANGTSPFEPLEWDYKLGKLLILPKKSFILPFEINKKKFRL